MESELWKCLPDDAEIVFRTSANERDCSPLRLEELSICFNYPELARIQRLPLHKQLDELRQGALWYKTFLVIDGIGRNELKNKYNITIKF